MKRYLIISLWVIFAVAFIALITFISREKKSIKFNKVEISINDNKRNVFITKEDIQNLLDKNYGSLNGKSVYDVNIGNIEKVLSSNPFISKSNIYSNIDGTLKINITERIPVVKVFNSKGANFYIDTEGVLFPINNRYYPRIIVAYGNINDDFISEKKLINISEKTSLDTNNLSSLQKIYLLANFINKSDLWNALVDQIYVENDNNFLLYLTIGNQTIFFGNINNMDNKFHKLYLFNKYEIPKLGWSKYKSINLKFANQLVCTKN